MPWNFPFWQVFRFAAPALMAGNVGLLKHASNVPQCALAIEDIFRRAGFPDGVFQTLLIGSADVAPLLDDARDQRRDADRQRGRGPGRGRRAPGARSRRRCSSSAAAIRSSSCPAPTSTKAAATAVKARTINNGQSCIAAKRFIVAEAIADEFLRRFVAAMSALQVGDPMDASTDVGPLATPELVDDLEAQVNATVAAGARVAHRRHAPAGTGQLLRADRARRHPARTRRRTARSSSARSPRSSACRSVDEAIRLANDSTFGLGASVWTQRRQRSASASSRELEAGQVFVNAMVASDPRLPFGGVKRSGYGRELGVARHPRVRERQDGVGRGLTTRRSPKASHRRERRARRARRS